MFESAVRRVARGAAHFDQKIPGWENKINIFTLDVSDPTCCPVAQLRPDGMGFYSYCQQNSTPMSALIFARRHGFAAAFARQYDRLTEAWRAEITKRVVNTIIEEVQSEASQVKESVSG